MRIETVRVIADWLKDETYGVNALLPAVKRDSIDEMPPLLATGDDDLACVYDTTRHVWVRKKLDPPNLPCIFVMSEAGFEVHGEEMTGTYNDSKTPCLVAIRYIHQQTDEEKGTTNGEYTLRAVKQSLKRLFQQDQDAYRTRNQICLLNLARVMYYPITEAIGESTVSGALVAYIDLRDANP